MCVYYSQRSEEGIMPWDWSYWPLWPACHVGAENWLLIPWRTDNVLNHWSISSHHHLPFFKPGIWYVDQAGLELKDLYASAPSTGIKVTTLLVPCGSQGQNYSCQAFTESAFTRELSCWLLSLIFTKKLLISLFFSFFFSFGDRVLLLLQAVLKMKI